MSDEINLEIITSRSTVYSLEDLCRIAGKNSDWVGSLLEYEVIVSDVDGNKFSYDQLHITLKALRLQSDLELNTAGVALALQLIDTIEQQDQELRRLRHLS